jgi:hypothetical protein
VGRAIERSIEERAAGSILLTSRAPRRDRHCAPRRLWRLAEEAGVKLPRMHPHMLSTRSSPRCSVPASTCATCRSPPATPTDRARKNLDRRPNYILAAYMASGT